MPKYLQIKDMPSQPANNHEWDIVQGATDYFISRQDGTTCLWPFAWGDPRCSEFYEEIKPARWRTCKGKHYWFVSYSYEACESIDNHHYTDNEKYEAGNHFKTAEDCAKAAHAMKVALDRTHVQLGY